MMLSNKGSGNVIETFSNYYVPVDCPEQDYAGFEIPYLPQIHTQQQGQEEAALFFESTTGVCNVITCIGLAYM